MSKSLRSIIDRQNQDTYNAIVRTFSKGDILTTTLIQRKCKVGYFSASGAITKMLEKGELRQIDDFSYEMML